MNALRFLDVGLVIATAPFVALAGLPGLGYAEFQGDERDVILLSMVYITTGDTALRTVREGAYELVKKRYPDAKEVRLGVKQSGLAVVDFERVGCPAHVVVFQPLRETEGEKSLWEFAVIRSPEEPAYECLGEAPLKGQ